MRFIRKGRVSIWSDDVASLSPDEMNKMVKKAGEISHRSHSKKTAKEFIEMLSKLGHLSVLEHSWFVFLIRAQSKLQRDKLVLELFRENPLFSLSNRGDKAFLVSGNARMFEEAYKIYPTDILKEIIFFLNKVNPALFPEAPEIEPEIDVDIILNPPLYPMEQWLHRAMTVCFSDISRGFSHEMVRSRRMAFTQESTRYVNYGRKGLSFILPYTYSKLGLWQKIVFHLSLSFASLGYNILIRLGTKPEDARQLLPIGIRTRIVVTGRFRDWLHWFKLRTDRHAHWEIRTAACRLLQELEKRAPELNLDLIFSLRTDKNGISYATMLRDEKCFI